MSARTHWLIGLVWVASSACVVSPLNGDNLAGTSTPVSFWGYGQNPSEPVKVEAAGAAAGPFSVVPIPGTSTSSQASWELFSSIPLYGFIVSAPIPQAQWHTVSGCSTKETFVRVSAGSSALTTFDESGGAFCYQNHVNDGASLSQAFGACVAGRSPLLRLTQGAVVIEDDVVIDNGTNIAALACIDTIKGSLTVTTDAPNKVSLPNLHRVTGDLNLKYSRFKMPGASAQFRIIDLPALEAVHGNVTLVQDGKVDGSLVEQPIDLGLNSLATVGGNVSLEVTQGAGAPFGLNGLRYVPGDLTIIWGPSGDIGSSSDALLSKLTEVAGTFTQKSGHNRYGQPLGSLASVGGLAFYGTAAMKGFKFPKLNTVTGSAYVENVQMHLTLIGLKHVGSLELKKDGFWSCAENPDPNCVPISSLEQVGGDSLTLDNLTLTDCPDISTLLDAQGKSKLTLSPNASFKLSGNNPTLTKAAICKFVAVQKAKGWNGPYQGPACPGS